MKRNNKCSSSYVIQGLRFAQILITLGIIVQIIRLFESPKAGISLAIYVGLLLVTIVVEKQCRDIIDEKVNAYVEMITNAKSSMFANSNIPVVIIEDRGIITWSNHAFSDLCDAGNLIGKNIKNLIGDINFSELGDNKSAHSIPLKIGKRQYNISVERVEAVNDTERDKLIIYFIDVTENELLKKRITDESCMIGYLCIDNIDEINHSIEEVRRPMLLAIIDRKINLWFKEREVVISRIERDKYIMVLNKKELEKIEETKFELLDEMRNIQVGNELPVTISIGIGYNLESLSASKEDARIAFDLAQGRGGDQAIIKNKDKYTFYGGKTKEVEKSARVKVRIKAYAFKELLQEADKVYVMGHKNIDMDCLGAAVGVYRAAALMGKKAQIVLDEPTFAIQALYDRIVTSNEYQDLFIKHEDAENEITKDTLLVVVDVHRKSYLEYEPILEKAEKVVVFDHHRRSTDFIEDAVLTYVEPYISSTCEIISEILNYISDKIKLTPIEADALLAGITIDTKNFAFKAGVRTFEAAAFLRRNGADSTRVRLLFQNDMEAYRTRATAIKDTEIWEGHMAVSMVVGEVEHANIIAAQVADELLNIKGIDTSFVLTRDNDYVLISARALGDVNVQRVMELLGGGGHLGIAGAQIKDVTLHEAKLLLREAIHNYLKEGEIK